MRRRILFPSARSGRSRSPPRRAPPASRSATGRRGRADEKRALAAQRRSASRCAANSCPQHTVLLDNKTRRGSAPATRWCTPLRLARRQHVLVNRGWIEARRDARRAARGAHAGGRGARRGHCARAPAARSASSARARRARCGRASTSTEFAAETGLRAEPCVIEQHSGSPTAWRATGRAPTPASRSTRATRCSGTRSPRSRVVLARRAVVPQDVNAPSE